MIEGKVNPALEARITIEVVDSGGQIHAVEAVLDTGFTGALTLSPDVIRLLELTLIGGRITSLTSGRPGYQKPLLPARGRGDEDTTLCGWRAD